jgi:hypothetical protein
MISIFYDVKLTEKSVILVLEHPNFDGKKNNSHFFYNNFFFKNIDFQRISDVNFTVA